MKKFKLFLIAAILCATSNFAFAYQFDTSLGVGLNGGTGYSNYCPDISIDGNLSIDHYQKLNINLWGGLRFTEQQIDTTGKAHIKLFPLELFDYKNSNVLDITAGEIFHVGSTFGISTDIDALIGGSFGLHFVPWLDMVFELYFQTKVQKIYAFDRTNPALIDISPAIGMMYKFNLPKENFIILYLSSWEDYLFPIFPTPSIKLGYMHNFNNMLSLEFDTFVRYSDFFTLTAYSDFIGCKLFVRYHYDNQK